MTSPLLPLLPLCAALWLAAGAALAQSAEPNGAAVEADWVEYRNAYRAMIWFEKYGKPKQFLQNHYRVTPRDKGVSTDGLRLTLDSKSLHLNLALDGIGRAVFPLSKAAYDDNAELSLNRKTGLFRLRPWVSIVGRADGVYEAADLRAACDQALAYLRHSGEGWVRGKQCVGVQFSYARNDGYAEVRFRKADRTLSTLPAHEGGAFAGDVVDTLKVVVYRFAALPDAGQVITRNAPLAIAPLIE